MCIRDRRPLASFRAQVSGIVVNPPTISAIFSASNDIANWVINIYESLSPQAKGKLAHVSKAVEGKVSKQGVISDLLGPDLK